MRQAVIENIRFAGKAFFLGRASLRNDFARGGVIKFGHIQPFNEGQHGSNTRLQVSKAQFVVFKFGHVHAGQPGRHTFGEIARYLDLAQQREHVGKQAGLKQRIGIDFFGRCVGFGFGQHLTEAAQHLFENGNRGSVDSAGHGFFR